jgi:hypothetical protein
MKLRLLGVASVCAITFLPLSAQAVGISGQGTWESTLEGRDLDGNATTYEAYYDTVLDITWLADANYAMTSSFDADGKMHWSQANNWITNLEIGGISGWRLPTAVDIGNDGCNFSYNGTDCGYNSDTSTGEMAHLFYSTLGNNAQRELDGTPVDPGLYGLLNTGNFTNFMSDQYWTGTDYEALLGRRWDFNFDLGNKDYGYESAAFHYSLIVHSGDVAVVPIPAAAWLFGSGLMSLVGFARRNKT